MFGSIRPPGMMLQAVVPAGAVVVPEGAWSFVPGISATGVVVPELHRNGVRAPDEVVLYGL